MREEEKMETAKVEVGAESQGRSQEAIDSSQPIWC